MTIALAGVALVGAVLIGHALAARNAVTLFAGVWLLTFGVVLGVWLR